MEMVLICRDALANSLLSNLVVATEAQKAGTEVAILFTQEALAALCGDVLSWSPGLQGQRKRMQMANQAKAMDLPISGRGEGKQVNPRLLMDKAREAGVKMIACPIWTNLLGLEDKLPEGIDRIDLAQTLQMVKEAKTVIGSL